jgi:hypothetical protein
LSLAKRNLAWNGVPRMFLQENTRASAPRVWAIQVSPPYIVTKWGQLAGAVQEAVETAPAVNVGKANYIPPEANAFNLALRKIEKRVREGYVEVDPNSLTKLDDEQENKIDFTKPLPRNLRFWKPVNTLQGSLLKAAEKGCVWYTRKRNGMALVICRHQNGEVQIYSRTMLMKHDDELDTDYTWNDRFPHFVESATSMMPRCSILLGELVSGLDVDRFDLAQSYIKSLTPLSLEDQKKNGLPYFYMWDVPFWDGKELAKEATICQRYSLLHAHPRGYFLPVDIHTAVDRHGENPIQGPEHAKELAKAWGWEGFVVVDPNGVFGDRAYTFKGSPERPACTAKLKPEYEDDFIVFWDPDKGKKWGERSTKNSRVGGIKSVALYQYNRAGELVYISNLASGMTKEMFATLNSPSQFPQVWRVWYTDRRYLSEGDDSNALDFPRIKPEDYLRTDKALHECVNERL